MADPADLRIRFRRSGGLFAGNVLETELAEAELPPEEARELRRLLEHVDLAKLARRSPIRGPGADVYQYDLIVEGGAVHHELSVSQTAVPPELRPLVERLERVAAERRKRAR